MSVTRVVPQSPIDDLALLAGVKAREHAALSGEFDARLEELRKVKEEALAAVGIANTVGAAAALEQNADQYAAKVRGDADRLKRDADAHVVNARGSVDSVLRREKELSTVEAKLAHDRGVFEKDQAAARRELDKRAAELQSLEATLTAKTEALKKDKTEVSTLRTMLNARLDSLKVAE